MREPSCAGAIDVFAAHDPELAVAHGRRLRWHAPEGDLGAALLQLQPQHMADVAWIRAGVMASRNWMALLQGLLGQHPKMGVAGPLDLSIPWCSPLGEKQMAAWHRQGSPRQLLQALADWLQAHASAKALQLGCCPGNCGVLRSEATAWIGAALERQASQGEVPSSWASLMEHQGWMAVFHQHVVAASGAHPASLGPLPASRLIAAHDLWHDAHPLTALRAAVADQWPLLQKAWREPPVGNRETNTESPGTAQTADEPNGDFAVRLHIAHSWGGGLSKWVRDFVQADQTGGHGRSLVLRSVGVFGAFGQRLCLYAGDEEVMPLRYWELGVPIHASATAHLQVQEILQGIVKEFGVDQVIVSSLIGHSLDVLRTGLPTLVVAHDHYPFCVTLYAHFEGECRQCNRDRLADCIRRNPAHRFFGGVRDVDWIDLREAFMQAVAPNKVPIVAPSPSVAARWQSMMPALRPSQFRVIPHGLNLPPVPEFSPPADGPFRVLVLGRLTPEKGVHLLMEMVEPLRHFAELILLGCGERLDPVFQGSGIHAIPNFDNDTLPGFLANARPHVGLLIPTVPETFSYTLSELWHAGIPVVATNSGALADRIEHGVTGFLAPANAQALLTQLRQLDGQRPKLREMRQRLLASPRRGLPEMVQDYLELVPARARSNVGNRGAGHWPSLAVPASAERLTYHRTLVVNPQVTWLQALRGFWQFTCDKASRSPRLPIKVRRLLDRLA